MQTVSVLVVVMVETVMLTWVVVTPPEVRVFVTGQVVTVVSTLNKY